MWYVDWRMGYMSWNDGRSKQKADVKISLPAWGVYSDQVRILELLQYANAVC